MIITVNDTENSAKPLYYQSLVLLYLPCEKFSESDDKNSLIVNASVVNGVYKVDVFLSVGEKRVNKSVSEIVDSSKYAQMKNLIGRLILDCFNEMFGYYPPWGISTGVKPVKLAGKFVSELGSDVAYDILTKDYMISPEKAKCAISAYNFEEQVMKKMGDNPCSLYVSIPFCPTKCNYCSFVSCATPRLISLIPDYLKRLKLELCKIADVILKSGLNLKSIYIGGGTPAILSTDQIYSLLNHINNTFNLKNLTEFTFEAGRPDVITSEKLKVIKEFGIERISINTQTSNDNVLKSAGRNHTFGDYLNAMEIAKKIGFKCINTDLIAGLPGEDVASFKRSVDDVFSLKPENITVHAFTLKKSSSLRVAGKTDFNLDVTSAVEATDYAYKLLTDNGYNPYYIYRQKNTVGNLDNVGYSVEGNESIYNIIMMGEYHTVFGAGAGSVTKIVAKNRSKIDRFFAPKYPYEFLDTDKYKGFDAESVYMTLKKGD